MKLRDDNLVFPCFLTKNSWVGFYNNECNRKFRMALKIRNFTFLSTNLVDQILRPLVYYKLLKYLIIPLQLATEQI